MTVVEKLKSRKFIIAVAALAYSVLKDDPKWGAIVAGIYIVIQGAIDHAEVAA